MTLNTGVGLKLAAQMHNFWPKAGYPAPLRSRLKLPLAPVLTILTELRTNMMSVASLAGFFGLCSHPGSPVISCTATVSAFLGGGRVSSRAPSVSPHSCTEPREQQENPLGWCPPNSFALLESNSWLHQFNYNDLLCERGYPLTCPSILNTDLNTAPVGCLHITNERNVSRTS